MSIKKIIINIENFYHITGFTPFRQTPGVLFESMDTSFIDRISVVDRVRHESGAVSPGPIDEVERPWYMHPYQSDNLLVVHGKRTVDLFNPVTKELVRIESTHNEVKVNGTVVCNTSAVVGWSQGIFHRIVSDPKQGSDSLNFATHYDGFDIDTNFNIYDVNLETGDYREIRRGKLDQNI